MNKRVFVGKSVIGWVAPRSLPRFGRLLAEPNSRQVFALDGGRQRFTQLVTGHTRQVRGPTGSHVYDAAWHPDQGLFFAFGLPHAGGEWALLRVSEDGSVQDFGFPAEIPVISLCYSDAGDLLLGVASLEAAMGCQIGGGIAAYSPKTGSFSWLYRPPEGEHFVPSGICWHSGAIVFVHTSQHALLRLTEPGRVEPVAGRLGRPASDSQSLNTPTGVSVFNDHYLVTDSGNHRVLLVARDGHVLRSSGNFPGGVPLLDPRHAIGVDGRIYIADAGARSVVQVCPDLRNTRGRWGGPEAAGLLLSRPRSIDRGSAGELIIADTNNDRIVAVNGRGDLRWQIRKVAGSDGRTKSLRWPRSARLSVDGRLVVSDSLNSRFLVLDQQGSVKSEFRRVLRTGHSYAVTDPHDGRWLGEDDLLVVDSAAGWVARVDCVGNARWVVHNLSDPHQATLFRDWVVIADPELDAVVLVDAATGGEVWRRNEFPDSAGNRFTLSKPRVVQATSDCVWIVDADSRVCVLGADWLVRWTWDGRLARSGEQNEIFDVPAAPRDLLIVDRKRILLSDYRRNCVLELEAVVPERFG